MVGSPGVWPLPFYRRSDVPPALKGPRGRALDLKRALRLTARDLADATGADERTVRRWGKSEEDRRSPFDDRIRQLERVVRVLIRAGLDSQSVRQWLREPNEYQINRIPGTTLIPLGEIPRRYAELDPNEEIVVNCKMGARSAKAADFLRSVGFKRVLNLKGGIIDWIDKVDPSQPKY